MVKIFVCDKHGNLEIVLKELKKRLSNLLVETVSEHHTEPFVGIGNSKDIKPRIFFYGNAKFDALIESVEIFQKGNFHISDRLLDFIDMIDKEVNIRVFVTQACGWCFPAIIKAVSFAYLSPNITVEVFDCYSFPQLATQYNVVTVPKTVINDKVEFVGTKDDNEFFGYIMKAIEE